MSRILYVCPRHARQIDSTEVAVAKVIDLLLPDNLQKSDPRIVRSSGIVAGISSPTDFVQTCGSSIAAGYLVKPSAWDRPRTGRPDGAYAIFRSDDAVVELVSDGLASRTAWFALTDDMFIAATSQRAIVAMLEEFQFNPAVIPWMLTSGTLGPGLSWDKRIRHLPAGTTVTLDRRSWRLTEHTEPAGFTPISITEPEAEHRVSTALKNVIGSAHFADPRWAITLSGGVDSRVILCLLENTKGMRAVTWGLKASLEDPTNDARIAQRLARQYGLPHVYFDTALADQPVDQILQRFVANGEGRIDHISGYADGFDLWTRMVNSGIRGVIRGDQAFGHKPVRTPLDARLRAGLTLWSDFRTLPSPQRFGLTAPDLPDWLRQRPGESSATWRDRLQQQFRTPFVLGALNDLKLPYVELVSPLLTDSIVKLIRQLPDHLRSNKAVLRRIAATMCPTIPFAATAAIQSAEDILHTPRIVAFLRDSLSDPMIGSVIPNDLALYAVSGLRVSNERPRGLSRSRLRQITRPWIPSWLKRHRSRAPTAPRLDFNRLAFRAYLLSQAYRMYSDDAAQLRRQA